MKTNSQKGIALVAAIIIVAALALVGGGAYYATTQSEVKIRNENAEVKATTSAHAQLSLRELFGKNVKCNFTTSQDGIESKGTSYINGENIRVDIVTTQNGKLIAESHMLKIGTDAYVWSSNGTGAGQGAKIKLGAEIEAQIKDKLAVDWDKKMNYDCDDWSPTQATFAIPTDIKFFDLGAAIITNLNASGQINKCASCDMVSDANAKAQCKAALGCK